MTEWEVSTFCEARNHNTLSASQRRRGNKPCTCPHALKLVQEHRERYRLRERARTAGRRITMPQTAPKPITAANYPDFTDGVCTSERGRKAAQGGMNDQASLRAIADRERAKALCNVGPCPIRDTLCKPWVLGQEDPPGSWGGVWGGMDPWNRRGLRLVILDGKAETVPYDIDRP